MQEDVRILERHGLVGIARRPGLGTALAVALLISAGTAASVRAQRWTVIDPGQGPVALSAGDTGATELSGLAWAGEDRYYAVSDKRQRLFPLRIAIDPSSGAVIGATLAAPIRLAAGADLEGVVALPDRAGVLVADEVGPAIREYRIADGSVVRSIPVPPVFSRARRNLGFESLTMDPARQVVWTANEEALAGDGPLSDFAAGTVVRLQRFDASGRPTGQWAYRTDPLPRGATAAHRDRELSGVSELVALPEGGLLVHERAAGSDGFRSRIYEVDFAGSTDVSATQNLAGATYRPVAKHLLWERPFPAANVEGAALGATLRDGSRSLVLISDDGSGLRQALYPLAVRPATR